MSIYDELQHYAVAAHFDGSKLKTSSVSILVALESATYAAQAIDIISIVYAGYVE